MRTHSYQLLANAVLVAHLGVVLFIVAGQVLILLGGSVNWRWVRNYWFRLLHLAAIGYVMAESWFGIECPLTTLEQWLRVRAGQAGFEDDFIAHWVGQLLFYHAPPWVFTTVYSLFALLVAASWLLVRPSPRRPVKTAPSSRLLACCTNQRDTRDMKTILISEDELAIADSIAYALRTDGFLARHVSFGASGLDAVRAGKPAQQAKGV